MRERLGAAGVAQGALTAAAAGLLLAVLTGAVLTMPTLIQLAVVGAVFAVALTFARPAMMITVYFLVRILMDLLWWIPGSVGSLNIMEMYTGGATVLAGALMVLHIRRSERHPALLPFLLYALVLTVGGLRNLEVRTGAEIFARYLSPFIVMFVITAQLDSREKRRRFVVATTVVCTIPVSISLFHLADGQQYRFFLQGYYRLIGGYMNLHPHALSMVIIAALAGWWSLQATDRRLQLAFLAYAGAATVCLYFTYVRTGIIALGIFTVVLLWMTGRRRTLALGIVAAGAFVALTPSMQDRFKDIAAILFPDDAIMDQAKIGSGRFRIWTAAIEGYLSQPFSDILLGLGIGKHFLLTREAFNPYAPAKGGFIDTHSDYLTMTFQVGPVATVSYITMQGMVAWTSLQVWRRSPDRFSRQFAAFSLALVCGASAANVLSNAFINRITQSWVLWGTAGLTFAEYLQLEREGRLAGRP
ncbi:MAG: O-antigen ligase family protein, partial [Myxococcota bacterium]|nr:O-antigen ligase family protein [Myxococcota bacterium]